ncbi:TlpA family protein disulfide reductase [bacterium]|nr:TlpA family protein disulfide reductase [bacterium]
MSLRTLATTKGTLLCVFLLTALAAFGPATSSAASKSKEGSPLPHFSAVDMDGNTFDTKDLKNQALLIDFWSIYCSSCIQEMPHIINFYNKYKDKGLTVVGIDLDIYGAKRVRKFLKGLDFTIPYPNIIDKKMEIKNLLAVSMLPTTVLVDPAGVIRMYHVGYKPGFERELEEAIKRHLPAP